MEGGKWREVIGLERRGQLQSHRVRATCRRLETLSFQFSISCISLSACHFPTHVSFSVADLVSHSAVDQ